MKSLARVHGITFLAGLIKIEARVREREMGKDEEREGWVGGFSGSSRAPGKII